MKVLKRNKYKYGVWQSMERAGGAVPQTPFCCARFLGLFSVQQPLVASWVTPNTLEFYWCQRKFFMPPPRCVCVCSACLAWEGSAPNCPVGEEGSREVCQLPALSCVLHSSSYSEAPQPKRQQRPSGGLSSCWPVIPFWRIMTYSNCKSLGIIYNIVHGCFVYATLWNHVTDFLCTF